MGRVFVGNHGGPHVLYNCAECGTYLTSHGELTSDSFTGSTGPAKLFRKVSNIEHGSLEKRKMTTGWHTVRDVFCVICKNRVGWMYEMAYEESQRYKETQVILENALVHVVEAFRDPLGADNGHDPAIVPFERPPGRTRRARTRTASSLGSGGSDDSSPNHSGSDNSANNSLSSMTTTSP